MSILYGFNCTEWPIPQYSMKEWTTMLTDLKCKWKGKSELPGVKDNI